MPDISRKSIGELIDQLITADIKCFGSQEIVCNETDPVKVAKAAKDAQKLNKRRCELMAAIDAFHNDSANSPTSKTY